MKSNWLMLYREIISICSEITKAMEFCGNNIKRVKTSIEGTIVEQVLNFHYLGNLISGEEKDISVKLPRYNKMNGIVKRNF